MNRAIIEIDNCYQCKHCLHALRSNICKLVIDRRIPNKIENANKSIPDWCPKIQKMVSEEEKL